MKSIWPFNQRISSFPINLSLTPCGSSKSEIFNIACRSDMMGPGLPHLVPGFYFLLPLSLRSRQVCLSASPKVSPASDLLHMMFPLSPNCAWLTPSYDSGLCLFVTHKERFSSSFILTLPQSFSSGSL